MYNMTNIDKLFENFLQTDLPSYKSSTSFTETEYVINSLEDGKQEITINVLGHNPKDIDIQATTDKITIKSNKPEGSSSLVSNVSIAFNLNKLTKLYDGTTAQAKFNNGLLILTLDVKEEKKEKTIQIKVV